MAAEDPIWNQLPDAQDDPIWDQLLDPADDPIWAQLLDPAEDPIWIRFLEQDAKWSGEGGAEVGQPAAGEPNEETCP
jgi:hypothetical protein